MKKQEKILIIDFDSTWVTKEGLVELGRVAVNGNGNREQILNKLDELTNLGMEGKISFHESLIQRLNMIDLEKRHIDELVLEIKSHITHSFLQNKEFIKKNAHRIYVISGGFRDFIRPVLEDFGIPESHIFANSFLYDMDGKVVSFDKENDLSKDNGKSILLTKLGFNPDNVVVIGDGYSDYEIKKSGLAKTFIAFTENKRRENVVKVADFVASNFNQARSLL